MKRRQISRGRHKREEMRRARKSEGGRMIEDYVEGKEKEEEMK